MMPMSMNQEFGKPEFDPDKEYTEEELRAMGYRLGNEPVPPTRGERFGAGVFKAMVAAPAQAALKLGEWTGLVDEGAYDAYTRQVDADLAMMQGNRPAADRESDFLGVDWMQAAGEAAPVAVAGMGAMSAARTAAPEAVGAVGNWMRAGGALTRTAKAGLGMAASGAAGAAPLYVPEDQTKIGQIAAGGVGGVVIGGPLQVVASKVVGPLAARVVKPAYNWLVKKSASNTATEAAKEAAGLVGQKGAGLVDDAVAVDAMLKEHGSTPWNQLAPDIQDELISEAARQAQAGTLDPRALANKALLLELGVQKPLTAQVTRNPKMWTDTFNAALGGDERIIVAAKEASRQMKTAVDRMAEKISRREYSPETLGVKAVEAIDGRWSAAQKEIGKLYKTALTEAGDAEILPVNLDSRFAELADYAGEVKALPRLMKRLETLALTPDKPFTLTQADILRKEIGQAAQGGSPTEKFVLRSLIETLDDDVFGAFGDNPLATARAAAKARFDEQTGPILSKVAKGTMGPQQFTRKLLTKATEPRDLRAVKKTLTEPMGEGAEEIAAQGAEAWELIRKHAYDSIFYPGIQATDDGVKIRYDAIRRAALSIGDDKLKVLFSPEELTGIYKRIEAIRLLKQQPELSAVNYSGSGVLAWDKGKQLLRATAFAGPKGAIFSTLAEVPMALVGESAKEAATKAALAGGVTSREIAQATSRAGQKFVTDRFTPINMAIGATAGSRSK